MNYWIEIPIRITLAIFVFMMLAVVGALGILGGDRFETENPDETFVLIAVHFFFNSYLVFWIVITCWIIIVGREKEIYQEIKSYVGKKKCN